MLQVKLPQLRINYMHKNPPEDLISHSSEEIKEYTDVIEGTKDFSQRAFTRERKHHGSALTHLENNSGSKTDSRRHEPSKMLYSSQITGMDRFSSGTVDSQNQLRLSKLRQIEDSLAKQRRKFVNDLPQCLRMGALNNVIDPELTKGRNLNVTKSRNLDASSKFMIRSDISGTKNSESTLKLVMGNSRIQ